MDSKSNKKVYRLRNLPGHVDRQSAAELLANCFDNFSLQNISIWSLAPEVDPWTRSTTKTATLSFKETPVTLCQHTNCGEWTFRVPALPKALILDHNFQGLTPLNEINTNEHGYDCIVISGLASHPLGSWQPHGIDKSFMWIRDELSKYLPTMRFILYGYNTAVNPSNSFQTISDLANSLINVLRAEGWTSPRTKPLVFLAHSLGGVILKEALVMLRGSGEREIFIASIVKGIIFFGVPSQGMPLSDILTLLNDQPNKEALVKELSGNSDYLPLLEKRFVGHSCLCAIKAFWAYETKTTRSVILHNGGFSRSGEDMALVTKFSATGGRYYTDPSLTIQIDENHSDMVKFVEGDQRIRVIASKLADICDIRLMSSTSKALAGPGMAFGGLQSGRDKQLNTLDPLFWDDEVVLNALHKDDLGLRIQEIEPRGLQTFDWVYDKSSIAFSKWLQGGQDIFWISGKPGSGKSTLMKFIHNDPRTSELLHRWNSSALQVSASFFFHYRGTSLQKSFEGLLRRIISQVLSAAPELFSPLYSSFQEQYISQVKSRRLGNLQSDIWEIIIFCRLGDNGLDDEIATIVQSQDVRSSLNKIFGTALSCHEDGGKAVERMLLRHRDRLLEVQHEQLVSHVSRLCKDLDGISRYDFHELILSWRENTHLYTQLRQLFQKRGFILPAEVSEPQYFNRSNEQPTYGHTQSGGLDFQSSLEEKINNLLLRQKARDRIRLGLQTQWSKERLEKVLHLLCSQQMLNLDLILMLDALDEYDGRPEFISGFLKDFVHGNSFPRTKVRILFSSRPWNVFHQEFDSYLGFKIHEHTENDIRSYCIASICKSSRLPNALLPLVERIVTRSSGVFLWVRLVLRDLFDITNHAKADGGQIEQDLEKKLDALPDQLDEYYATIIERISPASRWDTYVVLESLARTLTPLKATSLVDIIACSTTRCWPEADWIQYPKYTDKEAECFVRERTGGLVDFMPDHVQLMHQTVKDFVSGPQFRHTALGQDRGKITDENGHSFLAKYQFLRSLNAEQFAFHAREAERTTGLSQYNLFADAPRRFYQRRLRHSGSGETNFFDEASTPLTVAVFAGLRLFLEDAFQSNRHIFSGCRESLLDGLAIGMKHGLTPEEGLRMIESLVVKGFDTDQNHHVPWLEMATVWRDAAVEDLSIRGNIDNYLAKFVKDNDVLMILIVKCKKSLLEKSKTGSE